MSRTKLTVSAGSGPIEVRAFVAKLAQVLARDAGAFGCFVTDVTVHGDEDAPRSVDLCLEGDPRALTPLVGTHALVRKSEARDKRDRKRWFAGVTLHEILDAGSLTLDPSDVRVEVARAGGPGGQHVQKTESAVRVVHVPTGIMVRVTSERSQHQNRARALARLGEVLAARALEEGGASARARRLACLRVTRGMPVMEWTERRGALVRKEACGA